MAVSELTLAKKTKELILKHPSLVELDGTGHVPKSFQFNFSGDLEEVSVKIRENIKAIQEKLKESHFNNSAIEGIPEASDTSREAEKVRIAYVAIRAIHSLAVAQSSLVKVNYQTRNYGLNELVGPFGISTSAVEGLSDISSVFQFKRHADDVNPWVFSWMLISNGVSISRGTKQPIHKLITALLKLIDYPASSESQIQLSVSSLAKIKNGGEEYYWFLSNKHTAMWYKSIKDYLSLTSCMSKENSYYGGTGDRQHPTDCYDDSPDWRLMLLTTESPESILEMCELCIANPTEAHNIFKFPFVSRCMVLPTSKETSGQDLFGAPYVMGKFYGHDKLVNFFYEDSGGAYYNDNGLIAGAAYIDGGKIKAIPSTNPDYEGAYLLPHIDKANKARLVVEEDGSTWWVSFAGKTKDYKEPIAKGLYDQGIARFLQYYSPTYNQYVDINSVFLKTFPTIFGPECSSMNSEYDEGYTLGDTGLCVPNNLYVNYNGMAYLKSQMMPLFDGTLVPSSLIMEQQERFKRVDSLGLFDTTISKHVIVLSKLNIPLENTGVTNA